MRMKWRNLLSLCMAATLVVGASACGKTGETSAPTTTTSKTDNSGTDGTTPDETGTMNEFNWVVPEETLTISVYPGYGDQEEFLADADGGKATMDAWLLENMNVVINWEYYGVDMTERLNLMLVTGDYPDVITWMSDDMANTFAEQGKAIDLTELVEEYGDNITRRMGNYLNLLRDDEGKLSKLAQGWGYNPNVAGHDFGVRYDYWKELGDSDIYKTPAEYIDVVKRILENHPENDYGQQTYAFTSANKGENFLTAMQAAYGFINGYKADDNGDFQHWINTEEGYEFAKIVNQMYREDLIDPDYLSNGYEEYVNKLSNGQVIGNLGTWWYAWTGGHEVWSVDEGDAYDIEKRFMNVSLAGEGIDVEDTSLLTANIIGSYRAIITDNAKDPVGIMKFINWQNDELGNFITGWGAPAEDNVWNIAADGTWVVDDAIMDTDRKETFFHQPRKENGANIYSIATNTQWLRTDETSDFSKLDPRIDRVSVYDYWPVNEDGSFANEGINLTWQYYTAAPLDTTLYTTTFNPDDQITITNQTVKDTVINEWAKLMTAESVAAFDEQFESSKATLNALGAEDLAAYYQAAYEENLATFEGK